MTVEGEQGHLIYFHGCLGVGKSHLLASFAVQLLSQGRRVAFLSDCRAVLENPLMSLHQAFRLAFTGDEERQKEIDLARTLDELQYTLFGLCAGLETPLILIVDQCNALDYLPNTADRTSNGTKQIVRDSLNKLAFVVTKFESSGDYVHRKNFANRSIDHEHRISLFTGLTGVCLSSLPHHTRASPCNRIQLGPAWYAAEHILTERQREMASWWTSSGKMVYNILHEDDRLELEAFTGCLPFLLKVFSDINWEYLKEDVAEAFGIAKDENVTDHFKSGTLYDALITAMYEEFYASKRASNVEKNLVDHVRDSFQACRKNPRYAVR